MNITELQRFKAKYGPLGKHVGKVLNKPLYYGVIRDLTEFTGLTEWEVCERIIRRPKDKGHFVSEFEWHEPKSDTEVNWFYRGGQGYLFGSADRPFWEKIKHLTPADGLVLDYGGGVGTNTVGLAIRDIPVAYYDVSIVQSAFVRYRLEKRKLENHGFVVENTRGKENLRFLFSTRKVKTIILQDVLEHIPDFVPVLKFLAGGLQPGGHIIEYSPFNRDESSGKRPLCSPVHFWEKYPLAKAMEEAGMEKIEKWGFTEGIWQKKCVDLTER